LKIDRAALLLMIASQAAQLSAARPAIFELLVLAAMTRMFIAYHPRHLARVVEVFAPRP
jgi:hypothetical protein